ncbi:hypothetical protein DA2_2141 [Desulfovibrio sp. A2]|nr:hypothetical protein DA2_2141 [Desulfovibrio sp. A2]
MSGVYERPWDVPGRGRARPRPGEAPPRRPHGRRGGEYYFAD